MINGLPERLRKLRLKRNLSQKELADYLNLSPSLVSGYETGERVPSLEKLLALADFYQCSTDYLLGKNREEPVTPIDTSGLSQEAIQTLAHLAELMKKA